MDTGLSFHRLISDGFVSSVFFDFEYQDDSDITVGFGVDEVPGMYDWYIMFHGAIAFDVSPPDGEIITIRRRTGIDELVHQYNAGALFSYKTIDESLMQLLHAVQEAREATA